MRPLPPPFAAPVPRSHREAQPVAPHRLPAEDELPPIEQFLDDLPSIDDYVAEAPEPAESAEGWAPADWQQYDWNGLSALAAPGGEREGASAGWGPTDWPLAAPAATDPLAKLPRGYGVDATAEEVANALDAMARRIRSGELSIDKLRGAPPEAAMAAALAAFIKLRR